MESTVALAKYRREEEEEERLELPTGFRFHPRDEEIITYYLTPKVLNHGFSAKAMGEVDLNKCEPWDLPRKAKMGEKEWYFFCQKDKKYPTGMRTNRATETGYWKATGKDKEIYRGRGVLVGMKKTLVFYTGRAPRGGRTNWVMHEYRLEGKLPFSRDNNFLACSMDEWVVCKVFHKDVMATSKNKNPIPIAAGAPRQSNTNSFGFDATTQLHPIMNRICYHSNSTVWPAAAGQSFAAADHVDVAKLMALENLTFMLELDDPNLLFYHQALQSLPGPCTAPPSISTAGNPMMHGGGGPSAATSHHDLDGLLNELDSCSFDCSVLTCL